MMDRDYTYILGKKIDGFPYREKSCRYCEQTLLLSQVAHILDSEEHYKAVYFCQNRECGAFDEAAKKMYVLVYYSSSVAEEALYGYRIKMPERKPR